MRGLLIGIGIWLLLMALGLIFMRGATGGDMPEQEIDDEGS